MDGCLSQLLFSALVSEMGSLDETEVHQCRWASLCPFNARTIDIGTRDLNAVLHASANASCTKPCTYFFLKQSSHVVYAGLKFMTF